MVKPVRETLERIGGGLISKLAISARTVIRIHVLGNAKPNVWGKQKGQFLCWYRTLKGLRQGNYLIIVLLLPGIVWKENCWKRRPLHWDSDLESLFWVLESRSGDPYVISLGDTCRWYTGKERCLVNMAKNDQGSKQGHGLLMWYIYPPKCSRDIYTPPPSAKKK